MCDDNQSRFGEMRELPGYSNRAVDSGFASEKRKGNLTICAQLSAVIVMRNGDDLRIPRNQILTIMRIVMVFQRFPQESRFRLSHQATVKQRDGSTQT
jgi:hypothetical protein